MKEKFLQNIGAKITAFGLLLVMVCVAMASVLGMVFLVENAAYDNNMEELRIRALDSYLSQDAYSAADAYHFEQEASLSRFLNDSNFRCSITKLTDGEVVSSFSSPRFSLPNEAQDLTKWTFTFDESTYLVSGYLENGLPQADKYQTLARLSDKLYENRFTIPVVCLVSIVLGLSLYTFLVAAAGHRKGHDEIVLGFLAKVPLDLLTLGIAFLIFIPLCFAMNFMYRDRWSILFAMATLLFSLLVFFLFSIHLSARIKRGRCWKNTLLYRVGKVIFKLLHRVGGGVWHGFTTNLARCLHEIPFLWKAISLYLILVLLTLWCAAAWLDYGIAVFLLFLLVALVIPYCAMMLLSLQRGIRALAAGDLDFQLDTSDLILDFKKTGADLNCIAEAMSLAVEDRLKSERMKTELITNVSHDIKTPLTSIISYADLIAKEPCENEKINQYSEVLLRQSERLKKLIEDLMDASKASSGSMEIHLAPCELNVLLAQTSGEYAQKLEANNLTLVVKQPEHPVLITADGRLLWRVFDNLMSNVCKYALPGTRVYLTMDEIADEVVLAFKNTSAQPLDLPSEELMERFVRGDLSRHSEGNGLGLSIARSLVELQGGSLHLVTDGDLFKVVLYFPILPA